MDRIAFLTVLFFIKFLNLQPHRFRTNFVRFAIFLTSIAIPSFNKVSLKNLRHVFPEASEKDIRSILRDSRKSFTRFIIDCARFDLLTKDWYQKNLETPFNREYQEIKERNPGKGILVASGHMGSIEFQAFVAPFRGRKFSFIARPFKNIKLNEWWNKRRQKFGNEVIGRNGAVAKVIENINSGTDVAILIDQNITRKHAVFVDWFGRDGATTFALGLAAVETGAPIVLSAIVNTAYEKYKVIERECVVSDILDCKNLSKEEKILAVTEKVSKEYQEIIKNNPSEWFWMHRRWKTSPEGIKEDFYNNL
jgi:KDO2-lipid IV(A) lauroyltransferase